MSYQIIAIKEQIRSYNYWLIVKCTYALKNVRNSCWNMYTLCIILYAVKEFIFLITLLWNIFVNVNVYKNLSSVY